MGKLIYLFLLFNLCPKYTQGQKYDYDLYNYYILLSDSLYNFNKYYESAITYKTAFKILGNKGFFNDRYNAAKAWALAGESYEAFLNLNKLVFTSFFDSNTNIVTDSSFLTLHSDKRWRKLIYKIKNKQSLLSICYNKDLSQLIDSLALVDQHIRKYILQNKLSATYLYKEITKTDSLHYIILDSIFKLYSYPDIYTVGENSSYNFWLLVQHQDNRPEFQCKVLSSLKKCVKNNSASKSNYAYLLDRVKVNSNKLQVYGTQVKLNSDSSSYVPMPMIQPNKLNNRRKKVGLSTIEEYIKHVNSLYLKNTSPANIR